MGQVQTNEQTLLLYSQIDPNVGLTELNFGVGDIDAFGFLKTPPRVPFWAANGGSVPFRLTLRATNAMVTRGGGSPTPLGEGSLTLLMGPRGGELGPAPCTG